MESISQKKLFIPFAFAFILISCLLFAHLIKKQEEKQHVPLPPKIWIHRVNSIEKLQEVIPFSTGVELDLVYDESNHVFDVNHPPASSIHLSFDEYLSSIKNPEKYSYWLDYKNLNSYNSRASLETLNSITKKHHLNKNKIIIESDSPECLEDFYNENFRVSYYLPINSFVENEVLPQLDTIEQNLKKYPFLIISTNCLNYNIVKKHFPYQKKLLWISGRAHHLSISDALKTLNQMYNDTSILVILDQYEAKKGNR